MNRLNNVFVLAIIFFFACQSNINQPTETITYNGITITETVASFLVNEGDLAKAESPKCQLEVSPPNGTVYGHETDPDNVYLAQGGERLPSGAWTDQVYQDVYRTTLFSNASITFDNPTLITISNANATSYLDSDGNWNEVSSDVSVEAKAVSTGSDGACEISTSDKGVFESGGNGGING